MPAVNMSADPVWLEADSAVAVSSRLASDFSIAEEDGKEMILRRYAYLDSDDVDSLIACGVIETMRIDGRKMMHRKTVRNVGLLHRADGDAWRGRGSGASEASMAYADTVIGWSKGLSTGGCKSVLYRFIIDVPYDDAIAGDSLRVWMPFPRLTARQPDVRLVSAFPSEYVLSPDSASIHKSIYFYAPAPEVGDTAHFEYVCEYTVCGEYHSPESIIENIKDYDRESPLYRMYTSEDFPHIVRLDSLAYSIVGDERNPYRQSELVYEYISSHYPWAGAREYSTIPCITDYVVDCGHGDCGQVALLYISLMRTLGIPARWESGWMLHPGEKNLHDWAEVYFEGVGWIPVDVSFGRYVGSERKDIRNFYSTGIDPYRLAANAGICGALYPPKHFIRSETVDFQLGEVECSRGNLFYPVWNQHLQILEIKTVEL